MTLLGSANVNCVKRDRLPEGINPLLDDDAVPMFLTGFPFMCVGISMPQSPDVGIWLAFMPVIVTLASSPLPCVIKVKAVESLSNVAAFVGLVLYKTMPVVNIPKQTIAAMDNIINCPVMLFVVFCVTIFSLCFFVSNLLSKYYADILLTPPMNIRI